MLEIKIMPSKDNCKMAGGKNELFQALRFEPLRYVQSFWKKIESPNKTYFF